MPLSPSESLGQESSRLVQARLNKEHALLEMKRSLEMEKQFPGRAFSGGSNAEVADEEQNLAESPNFGTDAQAQVKGVQGTNTAMETYNRPDVTKQRSEDLARSLALESMKSVAPVEAQTKGALALENQKAVHESTQRNDTLKAYLGIGGEGGAGVPPGSQKTVHIGANGDPTINIAPPKPMGQLEQRAITSFKEAQPILDKLDVELGTPKSDPLSQLVSKGKNMATQGAYSMGLSTGNQTKQQLEGLLGVLGSSSYVVGSRSYQLIKQAMAHLTNANGSDAFNKQQINEIRALWPQMQAEVIAAHQTPDSPLNQGAPPGDPAGIR